MKKVSVSNENAVTLTCPHCSKTKVIDTTKYKKREGPIKIKFIFKCRQCYCGTEHATSCNGTDCKQGHAMVALLERRRHIRKKVDLPGKVIDERKNVALIKVCNISKKGLLLQVVTPKTFEVGQTLTILFALDNTQKAEIQKKVVIRKMLPPDFLGVEFTSADIFWIVE
jgi:PilZ domain-containing protein